MNEAQNLENMRNCELSRHLEENHLSDSERVEAEEQFVEYLYEMGEIAKQVELESFEVVKIDEVLNSDEIQALEEMLKDDSNFDMSYDKFFQKYIALSEKMEEDEHFKKVA